MIRRGRERRLDAVARTYLDAEAPRPRLVVVAGEDATSTATTSRVLQQAAADLEIPTVLLTRGTETVDLELGADRAPPVVVYQHGRVRESQLSALRPGHEERPGPDLLLWDLPTRASVGMRSLYLMGLWAWSIRPRQMRCVVPPCVDGDPPLASLRESVARGMAASQAEVRLEVLQRPGPWDDPGTRGLFAQILQSMLAKSHRTGARGTPPAGAKRKAGAWGWAVGLLFALAWGASGPARAQETPTEDAAAPALVTVEIEGIDLDDPRLVRRSDGTRISSGSLHLLRLEKGVGTRADDSLSLTTPRATLHAREGDAALDWRPRRADITDPLLLDAPEFTLQARGGRFEITPESIVITLADESSVLPGRQGMMLTGVLLVVIVMLFLRAAGMRKRLDKPYESVRRRRRNAD